MSLSLPVTSHAVVPAPAAPRRRWLPWALAAWIAIVVLAYPGVWLTRGHAFGADCAAHGIAVTAPAAFDGMGLSLRASDAALRGEVAFDRARYSAISANPTAWLRTRHGVGEGLSYFFFSLGSRAGQ